MPAPSLTIAKLDALPGLPKVTLLELVQAICDETPDDREVVETVRHLLRSGQVRLCGNFRHSAQSIYR